MGKSKKVQFTRRANGEGSVYQIKDGRYGAAYSLGKDENGKRLRHVETGKTEQEAIDKMKLWLAQNGYMGQQAVVINGQSSVEDFVEHFRFYDLKVSNISDVTFESYSYALKHFEQYFKGQRIGVIEVNDLKRFFIWMVNCQESDGTYTYSQATYKLTKYIVGRMFSNSLEENYLQENPMDNAKLKKFLKNLTSKKKTPDVESLSSEEIGILKNALMKNKIVYPVIALMSVTGMRTQEALGLQWQDIDFVNATINIRRAVTEKITWDSQGNKISAETVLGPTKRGKSDRIIEVPDIVINLLKEWRATAPFISKTQFGESDQVFGNSKSPSWTYAGFRSSVNHCLKNSDAGMDSLRLHRLRHTVATMMSNEPDANVYHIMQLLGHTQIKTAQRYIDRQTQERAKKNQELMGRLSDRCGLCG